MEISSFLELFSTYLDHRCWRALAVVLLVAFLLASFKDYVFPPDFVAQLEDWIHQDQVSWWERDTPVEAARRRTAMSVPECCSACSRPGTERLQRCSRCKTTRYCSVQCQRAHWKSGHKFTCSNLAKVESASPSACTTSTSADDERPVPKQSIYPYSTFLHNFYEASPSWRGRKPVGLLNGGNTCFANAALQCLLSTRPLVAYFQHEQHRSCCPRHKASDWCLLCELEELFLSTRTSRKPVSTMGIMKRIKRICKDMVCGRQEDAHEFLIKVLDAMEGIFFAEVGGKQQFDRASQETTFSHHLFSSYARNGTQCCTCGYMSKSYQCDIGLSLEIPYGVNSVDAALKHYFADETLDEDNQWKCSKCARAVRARKSARLETAPNVLIITLKRFMPGRFGKISRKVAYRDALDLSPYLSEASPDDAPATYSLYAVLVHLSAMNSTASGHCISYVKNELGSWFLCDDSTVREVSDDVALSQSAYLLFYIRNVPRTGPAMLCPPYAPAFGAPPPPRDLLSDLSQLHAAHDDAYSLPSQYQGTESLHAVSGGPSSSEGASDDSSPPTPSYHVWTRDASADAAWSLRVHLPGCGADDVDVHAVEGGLDVFAKGWAPVHIPLLPGAVPDVVDCKFALQKQVLTARVAHERVASAPDVPSWFDQVD